jgi:hypothetical protein
MSNPIVVISPQMIAAGVQELREKAVGEPLELFGEPLEVVVEAIYLMMEIERRAAAKD